MVFPLVFGAIADNVIAAAHRVQSHMKGEGACWANTGFDRCSERGLDWNSRAAQD